MARRSGKRKKRQPLRRNQPWWQERVRQARDDLAAVGARCRICGITLRVSEVTAGKTAFPHWRFLDRDGFCLLHFWPSNGKTLSADGASGFAADGLEAFQRTIDLLGERRGSR